MKKGKIAVMLYTEPHLGGEHQYALVMAECLKELSNSQYELIAIVRNQFWCDWCEENGIRYIMIEFTHNNRNVSAWNHCFSLYIKMKYIVELRKIIERERIEVLFFTKQLNFIPNLDVKIITPVHDLMHRYEPEFPEVRKDYFERELKFKRQAKYADYILTDSKLGAEQFVESYLKAKNNKKPHVVVLPFIVPEHVLETKEEYIDVPNKYVFYPAQFWKHKNHINLVKAIQILKESIEDIHLILVGSEKGCRLEIEKYILEHGLEKNITILGFVSNENITYLYRHAVGMIMPSYFGPTNIPPLEAMALGCPVAVSNKYAMPEQVGDAGLLFNPDSPEEIASCIKKLWTERELREEMIEKGHRKISEWTKEDFKKEVYKVIADCLV